MLFHFKLVGDPRDCEPYAADLAGVAAARIEASKIMGDFLRDFPGQVQEGEDVRLNVTDSAGLVQFSLVTFCMDAPVRSGSEPLRMPMPQR